MRALRQGLAETGADAFGYVAPQGLFATRVALADYLRRVRGVLAEPQYIVLCSGATQAVALLARSLPTSSLAMEDPGFWLHRMVLRDNGVEPIPVPVDEDGIDVGALAASGADAVLATPAHQSPTGVVLSAARRTELMDWARAGHLVIEDDYDAEYRYDRAPVGALQGIAPDRVIYVGSTSKTLAPGLRIGWMVLPAHLVGAVKRAKGLADTGSSVMDQLAFAQLLRSGGIRQAPAPDASPIPDPTECPAGGTGPAPAASDRARGRGRRSPDRALSRRVSDRGAGPAGREAAGTGRAARPVLRRSVISPTGPAARLRESH
ncbi:PLP-dependent aminotransferase family protein [Mycolicibacterium novocastrense]|nr:PLP-dependent aminotransferase family protein [Mycolicibacterium novocastrense]